MKTDWRSALCEKALEARKMAYCPYSQFAVGAALLHKKRQNIYGCNMSAALLSVV